MQYSDQQIQQNPSISTKDGPAMQTVHYTPTHQYVAMAPEVNPRFSFGSVLGLGISQLILGAVIVALQAVIIPILVSIAGAGVWMGISFLAAGIIGILCWKRKSLGLLRGYMVISIINSVLAAALTILAAMDATFGFVFRYYERGYNSRVHYCVAGVMSVLAFVEMVVAIVSSAMTCYGICPCCYLKTAQPVQYVNNPSGPSLLIVPSNQ